MANKKQTSPKMASLASKVLSNPKSGKTIKKLAATALAQTRTSKRK